MEINVQEKHSLLENRVLIVAPVGRDAQLTERLLSEAAFQCRVCSGVADLKEQLGEGVGLVLLSEEALTPPLIEVISRYRDAQPDWSELPLLLFVDAQHGRATQLDIAERLGRDVTVLTRPVSMATLLTVTGMALAARRRQYQVRDLLERLRMSEARFKVALKDTRMTVFHQDREGRYTWVANPTLPGNALGKRDSELFQYPEDAAVVDALRESVLAHGEPISTEVGVRTPAGERVFDLRLEALQESHGATVGVTGASYDITALRQSEASIRQLELEAALEERTTEVRQRIAQDLHDRVIQGLVAIKILATNLQRDFEDRALDEAEMLAEFVTIVGDVNIELRRSINELVSANISAAGLLGAIGRITSNIERWYGVRCRVELVGQEVTPELDDEVANHLYYITQEAVINAAKHAQASEIVVRLGGLDGFVLQIEDDGIGLTQADMRQGGLGLQTMRHRAETIGADLRFGEGASGGTLVSCRLESTAVST